MKKIMALTGILVALASWVSGQNTKKSNFSYGILFMAGGRYDNVRMCVASDAGVKGGPIADIMFVTRYSLSQNHAISFNLPVMRPILFGLSFKMLQFEPEFTYEYRKKVKNNLAFVTGPGLGVSLHYGPGYESDQENRGESFFAIGPFISWQFGLSFGGPGKMHSTAGIRLFYVPLFAENRADGTVLGGAFQYILLF